MANMSAQFYTNKRDIIKVIAGMLMFISFVTYGVNDPTPANLLWPNSGINNAFGILGALFSGLFMNWFGLSAFLIPGSLILLRRKDKTRYFAGSFENLFSMLIIFILISLFFSQNSSELIEYTGLWGYAANSNLVEFPGRLLSLLIVIGWFVRYIHRYQLNPVIFVALGHLFLILGLICKWVFGKNKKIILKANNALIRTWSGIFGSVYEQYIKPKMDNLQFDVRSIKTKTAQQEYIKKITNILFSFLSFKSAVVQQSDVTSQLFKIRDANVALSNKPVLGDALKEYERQYGLKGVKFTDENT